MTYAEKLKHPLWQKKRLEILERDKWACQLCGDTEDTLHVHHKSYHSNPWESPNDELVCYCEFCHTAIEYNVKKKLEIIPLSAIKRHLVSGHTRILLFLIDSDNDKLFDVYDFKRGLIEYVVSISTGSVDLMYNEIHKDKNG